MQLDTFRKLKLGTPYATVEQQIGKPKNDIGSGIHIFVYDLSDGSQVLLGFANLDSLLYVKHKLPNGSVENIVSENPSGKRMAPAEVKPVEYAGVKYTAPHFGVLSGQAQNGGYVEAVSIQTGKKVWGKIIYTYPNSNQEQDSLDVFITNLKIQNNLLVVTDEKGRVYKLNPVNGR